MDWMKEYGQRLRDNGYSIIPIRPQSKAPGRFSNGQWGGFDGWSRYADKPAEPFVIAQWARWQGCGIGILCGKGANQKQGVVGLDLDVLDPIYAAQTARIIAEELGETPVLRIGLAPKSLMIYRTEEVFSKITMAPLECLAYGQQFVGYGIHEKTGQPYTWPLEALADTPIERLPLVTAAQVVAAMQKAYDALPDEAKKPRLGVVTRDGVHVSAPDFGQHQPNEDLAGTPEACEEMLNRIQNPDLHWDDWNKIGMALWGASSGQQWGWELFSQFSQRSSKHRPTVTVNRWKSYNKSPPNRIGFGTLQHMAMQYDSTPIPADIIFNEAKKEALDFDISGLLATAIAPAPPPREEAPPDAYVSLTQEQVDSFPREWLETGSLVGKITRWIVNQALVEHPTLALGNTLAALGAVYGRRYRLVGESNLNTTANLVIVGIAPSGSGKDHSRKSIVKLWRAAGLGKMLGGTDFTSAAAISTMLEIFPSRLCQVDEFGLFLQSLRSDKASANKKSVMKAFLEFYSSAGGAALGQEYANQTEKGRVDIESPNFNVYGTTTPETLVMALDRSLVTDGTLNRMDFFPPLESYPAGKIMKASRKPGVPEDIVEEIRLHASVLPAGAGNLASLQQSTVEPETIGVYFEIGVEENLQAILDRQTEYNRQGRLVWGRLLEKTIKFAMIEAIARDPVNPIISEEILIMSYRLASWCADYLESIVRADLAENVHEKHVKEFKKIIDRAGKDGVSKTVLAKIYKIKGKERDEILMALEDAGDIVSERVKPAGSGRPTMFYKATKFGAAA